MFDTEEPPEPSALPASGASASTSAAPEPDNSAEAVSPPAETSERVNPPLEPDDPWDFSTSVDDEKNEAKTAEVDETEAEADDKEDSKDSKDSEKSLEEEVLDEVFEGEKVDLDKLDPEKMLDAQRNKIARAWAEKNHKKAELVRGFQNSEKPIEEVLQDFSRTSPERFGEMSKNIVHAVIDKNPDAAFERIYAVKMRELNPDFDLAQIPSLDEIISGNRQTAHSVQTDSELSNAADKLTETLGFDWRNPENDFQMTEDELPMVQMIRSLEAQTAKVAEEKSKTDAKYEELEKKLNDIQGNLQESGDSKLQEAQSAVGREFRDSVEEKLMPRIAKKRGLDIAANDTEEVKAVKTLLMQEYTGSDYEREKGIGTKFEEFAFNQSTVAKQLTGLQTRIGKSLDAAANLRAKGKQADASQALDAANEDRISLITFLAKADDEFAEKHIAPFWKLLGKTSAALAQNNSEASGRIEITNGGAGSRPAETQKDFATAEDVWGSMVDDSRRTDALRAGQ